MGPDRRKVCRRGGRVVIYEITYRMCACLFTQSDSRFISDVLACLEGNYRMYQVCVRYFSSRALRSRSLSAHYVNYCHD